MVSFDAQETANEEENVDLTRSVTQDKIGDVYLPVSIELARTRLYIKEILELEEGAIIEFYGRFACK